ncbi:hypothetical protein LX69_01882 [Breznakibacter xylanolyticus]|uniref:Uncharacterized protein n=1 Tax=Breznakibacter xylanolyticus TaxID=990 RepID=A0A2W7N8I3_9BACT|nr:hypothetical protein [Breznakibacter xylanolyticus]MBN2744098.1 hypothetical protein [Marinilabiliaceae bacterium]PZX16388.1 hypothetical protein LX69_01882 [Breznakibacter xylanolyticus]
MNQTISPTEELKRIREMMEASSKFISLSGLSGMAVGLCAMAGALVAHWVLLDGGQVHYDEYLNTLGRGASVRWALVADALVVLVAALVSAWYLSYRKARKLGLAFWTPSARRMVVSLMVVLGTGGMFCLIMLFQGYFKLVAASMLIFYGLALLHASKYSKHDIASLAYVEISLGLLAAVLLNYGLLLWTVGFGLVHVVYGVVMYWKYDRVSA